RTRGTCPRRGRTSGAARARGVCAAETAASVTAIPSAQATRARRSIVAGGRRGEHLSGAVRLQSADNPGLLHGFHHPRGPVVADLQAPLYVRDGRPAGLGDDSDRLIVKRILLPVQLARGTRLRSGSI